MCLKSGNMKLVDIAVELLEHISSVIHFRDDEVHEDEEVWKTIKQDEDKVNLDDNHADYDDEPDSWITLENGEHVPLDEKGNAIGGAGGWAKGKNFSNSQRASRNSTKTSKQPNKENGLSLYKQFIEGEADVIHKLLGVDMVNNEQYDPDMVDEQAAKDIDSIFTPAEKPITVYKGMPLYESQLEDIKTGNVFQNPTLSSTSKNFRTAQDYADRAYDIGDDLTPVFLKIRIEPGTPIVDTTDTLGTSGMKGYEQEITIGRNTEWIYENVEMGEDDDGYPYCIAEVTVRPKRVDSRLDSIPKWIIKANKKWSGKVIDREEHRNDESRWDYESEPDSWITLENGQHVPLDENGTAIGGAGGWATGKDFSKAKKSKKQQKNKVTEPHKIQKGELDGLRNGSKITVHYPTGETQTFEKRGAKFYDVLNPESIYQDSHSLYKCPYDVTIEEAEDRYANAKREPVSGKDIVFTYTGDVNINSVLKAQGYDGLPKVVSQEEFDNAVKESKFIAQRNYTASSPEILEAYHDQLINGDFYVDCSVGGSMQGQGMYCAADYTGTLSDGIKEEMRHYSQIGDERFGEEISDEERYKQSIKNLEEKHKDNPNYSLMADVIHEQYFGNPLTVDKALEKLPVNDQIEALEASDVPTNKPAPDYTETITLAPDAKIIKAHELRDKRVEIEDRVISAEIDKLDVSDVYKYVLKDMIGHTTDEEWDKYNKEAHRWWEEISDEERFEVHKKVREIRHKVYEKTSAVNRMDDGVFAALLGYDAINAEGHGRSGSYTVILNRTKCIFLDTPIRHDEEDDESRITFQQDDEGNIWAIQNKQVVGWVRPFDARMEEK